ncbi:cytochrome P450 2D15-like protein, partial [Lates japonicus]
MFASVALLLVAVLLFQLLCQTHRAKYFPPGPRALPIFGNLLQLNLESPIADLERLAKRYGNVYSLFIGPRPAVVINGLQALKEALVNKAADFSGRPQDLMVNRAVQVKDDGPVADSLSVTFYHTEHSAASFISK